MDKQVLLCAFNLNNWMFDRCLENLDEGALTHRPNPHTNNIAFIAAHLIDARFYLIRTLGGVEESPFKELLDPITHIDQLQEFPSGDLLHQGWQRSIAVLGDILETCSITQLANAARALQFAWPGTLGGNAAFLLQHETYHLGQLALLRRLLGYPAVSWGSPSRENPSR